MFEVIKLAIVGAIVSLGWTNIALARACQNEKISQFDQIYFSPNLEAIDGDINGDGLADKLVYNLVEGWITLDFYTENVSWDKCRPNLTLKLVSSKILSEVRGWDLETTINRKGSVRISSCYYGGSRGLCHDEYNFVLRYVDKSVQIIGYDRFEQGINYPSLEFSVNLLTGRSIITRSPGVFKDQLDLDAVQNTKTQYIDYGMHIFRTGDVIAVPEELEDATKMLYNELAK